MNKVIGTALLAATSAGQPVVLPSLDFADIENQLPSLINQSNPANDIVTEMQQRVEEGTELEALSESANEAEAGVYEKLKAKVEAENEHATAQWAYSADKTSLNMQVLEEKAQALYKAKNDLAEKKVIARNARIAYSKQVATIGANDEMSLKGLDSNDNGTGIPGGLDEIGINAASMFLPGQRLSTTELNLHLEKLKYQYNRRKLAINAWKQKRINEAEDIFFDKKNLEVLKKRTAQRLKNGKNKTETYRKAVRTLLKDYQKRFQDRQLNKFQWDQIREWATGKFSLSKERYGAFKDRIISKYKSVLERSQMLQVSKRRQKAQAKKLAQEQLRKNRETYELAKKRLLQGRVRSTTVFGGNDGSFPELPSLGTLGNEQILDPIGGLDPFAEMDGIDDSIDF